MSRWLFIGGTRFVGYHLAHAAMRAGHEVTLFHRGETPAPDLDHVEHILGDRDGGLEALAGRTWDVVVDTCGYLPRLVGDSARYLAGKADCYVFISSISVFPDREPELGEIVEDDPVRVLTDPDTEVVDEQTYGALKARCEDVVRSEFPGRSLVIRPGYIVGPRDPSQRFTWWVHRLSSGDAVLVANNWGLPIQFVDVRDLARFIAQAVDRGLGGTYNVVGPTVTWGDFYATVAHCVSFPLPLVVVDQDWLVAQEMADEDFPLWLPDSERAQSVISSGSKAIAAGLVTRPLEETVQSVMYEQAPSTSRRLSPEKEREMLEHWRHRER